jgi:hypothetical protein
MTIIYKNRSCCDSKENLEINKTENSVSGLNENKPDIKLDEKKKNILTKKDKKTENKVITVYYFYANPRCYSCQMIEEYTRFSVESNFKNDYNGYKVVFKAIDVGEPANSHYIQDYWLNSKSVVIQKFINEKPLKWRLLDKVWQLLGSKDTFVNYVTSEIKNLVDEK